MAAKVESAQAELARKTAQLEELSAQLAALDVWTRPEPGSRKPRFSRDEIAAAAVRIADEEGFEALSMRRLAAELDAGTMTLYHYVKTKDELLTLVNDTVMGEVLVPPGELPTDWRAAITVVANRSRQALERHPWALDIRDDPAPGPNGVRHFDQTMQTVMALDLSLGERFELVTAVDEYVFGYCLMQRANATDDHEAFLETEFVGYVDGLIDQGDLPALAAIKAEHGTSGAFEVMQRQGNDPGRFDRNLARLLDGFEADYLNR
ncbi:MAG: TetR/AcrR family transcriptional regulator [Ilumatobacteraceae bacterium]